MNLVYQLTQQQAQQLKGSLCATDLYFNPIEDANGNFIITQEEVDATNIDWVKELPTIEYVPKVIDFF